MKAQRIPRFAPGIVTRLRGVFVVISVVLVISTVVGILQLRELMRSVDELTVSSVTVFVRAEETERSLKNLVLLLQRVDLTSKKQEIAPLALQVQSELSALRIDAAALAEYEPSSEVAERMEVALDRIEASAELISETKSSILSNELTLEIAFAKLNTLRETMRSLIEDLSFEVEQNTNMLIQREREDGIDPRILLERQYNQNLLFANAITEIALETEAIVDIAINLSNLAANTDVEDLETTLRFKMRDAIAQFSQLHQSDARTGLAGAYVQMRELFFNDGQIFDIVSDLQSERVALDAYKLSQLPPIQDLSDLSSTLTQTARGQIYISRYEVTQTTYKMILLLVAASFVTLCVIGLATLFVVERQINHRMARLTKSVMAIADGEKDHVVDVRGEDELGKMAVALEVFKHNAEELRRSNAELEKFAYVASHDLRSPLRAIQDLTEWTIEDENSALSEDGKANLTLLKSRVIRLSNLLADLLEYSRAGQESWDISCISVATFIDDIADSLDPNNKFQIEYDGSVTAVVTFATPFQQILTNLINNAIKHHDNETGKIEISISLNANRIRCSVCDDGAGIEPQYHDRIFGLFQTLRPRDEVEGSGLGLAIISKLLEHYDCSIEVHSSPKQQRGTKFVFDFPEKSQEFEQLKHAA